MLIHKSMLLGLVLVCSCLTLSAAETSVLLIGESKKTTGEKTIVSGGARAILKTAAGQTKITADEITFDAGKTILLCAGDSTISGGDRTYKGKDITIELAGSARVFVLKPGGKLHLGYHGENPGFESWSPRAEFIPQFEERLPNVDLGVRRSSRAPQPSLPFVTPRTFQVPPER